MISQQAVDLILDAEGLSQPSRWPGGESGITLGHGYDLGYTHPADFARDWAAHLTPDQVKRLSSACLLRGAAARAYAARYVDIVVSPEAARDVFLERSLPRYEAATAQAFGPGWHMLPDLAAGALVSLVYNRGGSLVGARRAEMRAIRAACDRLSEVEESADPGFAVAQRAACVEIAAQLRAMKRLWIGQGLDGLLARREAEARLVERAAHAVAG